MPASHPDPAPDPARRAEEVFASFLLHHQEEEEGAFAALCRAHPDLEARLRALREDWQRLASLLSRLGVGGSLSTRIRERFGADADPNITLPEERQELSGMEGSSEVISRLSERGPVYGRYRLRGELARGGMGAILRVWDEDLRRSLAMKIILGEEEPKHGAGSPRIDARRMARFLEEAQVTSQLDHPGIVPVHELGLDPQGRVYFTMKLVRGRTLREIFELVHDGQRGWTKTRALGLLLKVCEAMSYAHAKRVIHRDLKPANVMVGRYGEVFVMDWGLARLLDREDEKDIRIRPEPLTSSVHSERHDRAVDPDSPLVTMDGDIVGTPAYMPPEQACGRLAEMGPQSDVYAVGGMLYHLLAGQMPYVPPGARVNNYAVWSRVQEGPPRPLAELAPDAPGELVAICAKAMARDPQERYRDMAELGQDLRAYLEDRVVRAYATGPWVEARKWMRRNPGLARALAAVFALLVIGLSVSLMLKARAEHQEELVRHEKANVLRLSAFQDVDDLTRQADEELWPPLPAQVPAYEGWLRNARALVAGLYPDPAHDDPGHLAVLAELRSRALPAGPAAEAAGRPPYRFARDDDRWWHAQLEKLIAGIEAFSDPETGLVAGISPAHGWGVEQRLAFAGTLEERSVSGPEASRRWTAARAAIAANERYRGLDLPPQLGLLPLGEDPESHLYEFLHLQSGAEPARDPDGRIVVTPEMGIVLVLLPGGTFRRGAQSGDPGAPAYHSLAESNEGPLHDVSVSPFFLSKYEMTQAQWTRLTGRNPSLYQGVLEKVEGEFGPTHPVEHVHWFDCDATMRRANLVLPSEAQWEYAARGGTLTAWWTGDDARSLLGAANVADRSGVPIGVPESNAVDFDDGYPLHAPVGTFRPNPFGLHDVHGNVWEWCLDWFDDNFYSTPESRRPDPVGEESPRQRRAARGACFYYGVWHSRSAARGEFDPLVPFPMHGLRPARAVSR
ncbi:MAG: bifunctional serine/threonine-protein kinase/formylglycine-generating enzyme family protein [Planctomycetota bacterium]